MQTPAGSGERGANHAYRLCGLKLESQFELPALPEWDGPANAPADVHLRLGKVPPRLSRPDHVTPLFQTSGTAEYLLALPGTGRIQVRNGDEITVEPETGEAACNLSAILTGTIQAVLWHQRGLLPLHASVVVIRGRAIALCGCGAAGKSTLAAVLATEGHYVIADDICVVDARRNDEILVSPDNARPQLWPDALAALGLATNRLKRALAHKEKYFLDCGNRVLFEPPKLVAVVLIVHPALAPAKLERLRGARAADALHDSVHTRQAADALGRAQPIFMSFTRMASAGVSFWRLMLPEGRQGLRDAAKLLTAL
jgi:hypothetical protein